jgi:hypothetical protein
MPGVWLLDKLPTRISEKLMQPDAEADEARKAELIRRMTAAMREADKTFERVGGSTRHHIRDCLLPVLGKYGLRLDLL